MVSRCLVRRWLTGLMRECVVDAVGRGRGRRWLLRLMVLMWRVVLAGLCLGMVLRLLLVLVGLVVMWRVVLGLLEYRRVLARHRSVSHILVVIMRVVVSIVRHRGVGGLRRRRR